MMKALLAKLLSYIYFELNISSKALICKNNLVSSVKSIFKIVAHYNFLSYSFHKLPPLKEVIHRNDESFASKAFERLIFDHHVNHCQQKNIKPS
jgi:hypothetical protein